MPETLERGCIHFCAKVLVCCCCYLVEYKMSHWRQAIFRFSTWMYVIQTCPQKETIEISTRRNEVKNTHLKNRHCLHSTVSENSINGFQCNITVWNLTQEWIYCQSLLIRGFAYVSQVHVVTIERRPAVVWLKPKNKQHMKTSSRCKTSQRIELGRIVCQNLTLKPSQNGLICQGYKEMTRLLNGDKLVEVQL